MDGRRKFIPPSEQKVFEIDGAVRWTDDDLRDDLGSRIMSDLKAGSLEIRPLPRVALELSRLASNPDPNIRDAISMIEHDAPIATRVLKVAASPAVSKRPPRDLSQAAMSLGVNGLRDLAFAASVGKVFRCGPLDGRMRRELAHAFAVGLGTAYACRVLGIGQQHGFLCGMLHDIGAITILTALADYGRNDSEMLEEEFVDRTTDLLHEKVGAALIAQWGLDKVIQAAAQHHHCPQNAGPMTPIVLATATANAAAQIHANNDKALGEALCQQALGYQAGLSAEQLFELASVVHRAKSDPMLASMAA